MKITAEVSTYVEQKTILGWKNSAIRRGLIEAGLGSFGETVIRHQMSLYPVEEKLSATVQDLLNAFRTEYVSLPLPPKHLEALRIEDMGFDTSQEAVAVFSDYHYGGKVDPRVTGGIGGYNAEIARDRLVRWRNGVLRFTQLIQLAIHVPTLNILALGDDMEGNGHMFPTQSLQMEFSAYFQFMGFVNDVTDVLIQFLSRFEHINVYKVMGNHGRLSGRWKDNYDPDNIELFAWELIRERCEMLAPGQFTFKIEPSFWQTVQIQGYTFLIRHGDGLSQDSTYTGIVDTKLAANSILGRIIHYMVTAHFHSASEREYEIEGSNITNGCFVGPSLHVLKGKRPRANRPSQEMFFVHPKYGVTHHHRIHLATAAEIRNYS